MKKAKVIKETLNKVGFNLRLASEMKVEPKIRMGIFAFDYVTSGIFQGEGGHRLEFFGPENSGKTTFAYFMIKKFQSLSKKCVFINGEQSYDADWAAAMGVDNTKLQIAEPDNLEQAGDMLTDFIGKYDLIVMDSIPSIITKEELEGTLEENKYMASQAKVYSPMMRKLMSATKQHSPTIVFINQLREKIGIAYGNPIITPGGRALKHFYNTRIEFRIGQKIKEKVKNEKGVIVDGDVIGQEILLNCTKNKRGKPHRIATLDFYLNGHIDNNKSLFFSGLKNTLIERNGNTYKYDEIEAVGQEKFLAAMTEKHYKKLENDLWKIIK